MPITRRSLLVYILLFGVWALVLAWQVEEHARVRESAKTDLRHRSREIANTLSALIRGFRFRGTVLQENLELVLREMVNQRTNEIVKSSGVISIALLNVAGDTLASAGQPIDTHDLPQEGELWGPKSVTLINPVLGVTFASEGPTNPTVVLPPFRDFSNSMPEAFRNRPPPRREGPPEEGSSSNNPPETSTPPPPPPGTFPVGEPSLAGAAITNASSTPQVQGIAGPPPGRPRGGDPRWRRPPWLRGMSDEDFQALIARRAVHGLVLAMSTESIQTALSQDLVLRSIIAFLATVSVVGSGLAWRNVAKTSELQIRLVRASEMNTHLKEMNLAAAGLAHETRNPLNIIRGLAQIISRQEEAAPEIRKKSKEIIDETDKVTAQLNEFINYSRPRELRRTPLVLGSVVAEVIRALNFDIEEKKILIQAEVDALNIEADEQLLRQALFNLILNAIQAVGPGGEIRVVSGRRNNSEAFIELQDDGPGVPSENRSEVFKPYFTTQKQGTGLGLAVVQQIVLAHGWEIECLANQPKGATFRITHVKVVG
jgi:signal transduction histidine kinase